MKYQAGYFICYKLWRVRTRLCNPSSFLTKRCKVTESRIVGKALSSRSDSQSSNIYGLRLSTAVSSSGLDYVLRGPGRNWACGSGEARMPGMPGWNVLQHISCWLPRVFGLVVRAGLSMNALNARVVLCLTETGLPVSNVSICKIIAQDFMVTMIDFVGCSKCCRWSQGAPFSQLFRLFLHLDFGCTIKGVAEIGEPETLLLCCHNPPTIRECAVSSIGIILLCAYGAVGESILGSMRQRVRTPIEVPLAAWEKQSFFPGLHNPG